MTYLASFVRFIWDFVVGDDWRIAAGAAVALTVTAMVSGTLNAWWIVPAAASCLLSFSVWRAAVS